MPLKTIAAAAFLAQRHPNLIRRWYLQGHLQQIQKDPHTGAILLDLTEVIKKSQHTPRRNLTNAYP